MDEISNKTLAILLTVAIVVSIGGTLISVYRISQFQVPVITQIPGITGFAQASPVTGQANLTVVESVAVTFRKNMVEFGSGYVNSTNCQACNMTTYNVTDDTCCAQGWTTAGGFNVPDGLWIANTGNKPINLNVTSNATAAQFIGGTNPVFQWNFSSGDTANCTGTGCSGIGGDSSNSCEQPGGWANDTVWTDVITTTHWACGNATEFPFNFTETKNEVEVNFRVSVPENAPSGAKWMTLTAIGASS
jgi:hypothetical protein